MKKRIKVIIILLVVVLILLSIFGLSRLIVSRSYSSLEVVQRESQDEEAKTPVPSSDSRVYVDDGTDSDIQRVSRLFDPEDLEERQEEYLGEDFERFRGLLSKIESEYSDVFSEIDYVRPEEYEISIECTSGVNDFSVDMLEEGINIQINSSLTVIGMYGESCIAYANGYPYLDTTELIVVDYSNAPFNVDARELMNFGDICSLLILDGSYRVDSSEWLPIVYVKG